MKFKLLVSHIGRSAADAWTESYDDVAISTLDEALSWGKATIVRFNATLRANEVAREIHSAELDGESTGQEHHFLKTNLFTLDDAQRGMYDLVKCEACGCVARRYGLKQIVRQTPFRGKKWAQCVGSQQVFRQQATRERNLP